jgi:hypothetical protein
LHGLRALFDGLVQVDFGFGLKPCGIHYPIVLGWRFAQDIANALIRTGKAAGGR